jgi:hypothetical protein
MTTRWIKAMFKHASFRADTKLFRSFIAAALPIPICLAAAPCLAGDITLRPMPPFHRSDATCLTISDDGDTSYWLNHCSYAVSVRWTDEAKCQNWSCTVEIPANTRSTAAISRHARWCECAGSLASCKLPEKGC